MVSEFPSHFNKSNLLSYYNITGLFMTASDQAYNCEITWPIHKIPVESLTNLATPYKYSGSSKAVIAVCIKPIHRLSLFGHRTF